MFAFCFFLDPWGQVRYVVSTSSGFRDQWKIIMGRKCLLYYSEPFECIQTYFMAQNMTLLVNTQCALSVCILPCLGALNVRPSCLIPLFLLIYLSWLCFCLTCSVHSWGGAFETVDFSLTPCRISFPSCILPVTRYTSIYDSWALLTSWPPHH